MVFPATLQAASAFNRSADASVILLFAVLDEVVSTSGSLKFPSSFFLLPFRRWKLNTEATKAAKILDKTRLAELVFLL